GVAERQYSSLIAGADGTVFYLEATRAQGAGGGGGFGGASNELNRYRLSDRRAAAFVSGVAAFDVSADGHKLVYRSGGGGGAGGPGAFGGRAPNPSLFIVDADRTPPQPNTGRVNYTLRMYLDPKEEFKQIFNEMWRNERDYLYVPNMHGTDWNKDKEMYGAMLPYVMHRADLNYLMDMMGAEIAIGHSYVRGGYMPDVPNSAGGLLGADFAIDNGRYKVTRIYDNENWNPELRSPLGVPGVNVNVGDYILAINGTELTTPDNTNRVLDGTANRQTSLTINDQPTLEGA